MDLTETINAIIVNNKQKNTINALMAKYLLKIEDIQKNEWGGYSSYTLYQKECDAANEADDPVVATINASTRNLFGNLTDYCNDLNLVLMFAKSRMNQHSMKLELKNDKADWKVRFGLGEGHASTAAHALCLAILDHYGINLKLSPVGKI